MKRHLVKYCAWLLTAVLLATAGWAPASAAPARDTAWGDVDQSGAVNAADALLALQHSVHLTALDAAASLRADVNGDGAVNAADALLILQYSVKLIDRFPVVDTLPPLITVTFDTGDKPVALPAVTGESGDPLDPPAVPPVDGWRFDGWLLDGEPYVFTVIPDQDITLTAAWTRVSVLTFDTGNGEPVEPIVAEPGTPVTLPVPPRYEGNSFTAWLLDGEPVSFNEMPEESLYLTALWQGQRKLTYETGVEGLDPPPVYLFPGEPIVAPLVAPREGYELGGWLEDGRRFLFSEMPDWDVTLTAEWRERTILPILSIELRREDGSVMPIMDVDRDHFVKSTYSLTNMPDGGDMVGIPGTFKGRGNGSWSAEKRGYRLRFDQKLSLFGQPKDRNWVILAGINYGDKTLCRNYMAFNMAKEFFDGMEYSPAVNWVDVYINGEYRGVYALTDKIRAAQGRVDVESDGDGDDMGFLVEYDAYAKGVEGIDWFRIANVKYPATLHYPACEDYLAVEGHTVEQFRQKVAYVKDYVNRVYAACLQKDFATLCELADVDSFVDMYILQEYFKNCDCGWSSFFMYKKPGGKLCLGPPWDFDGTTLGTRGDASYKNIYVARDIQIHANFLTCEIFVKLYETPEFLDLVKKRWQVLAPQILDFVDRHLNDQFLNDYAYAMGRNFVRWNGRTQARAESVWRQDVINLRNWLNLRVKWLSQEWALDE